MKVMREEWGSNGLQFGDGGSQGLVCFDDWFFFVINCA
jgi:hypothetical protein